MSDDSQQIACRYLGRMDYLACYDLQQQKHSEAVARPSEGCILMVEHPKVLTLGRHGKESNIKYDLNYLRARNISVHRVERGGDVTAHMPGQLVVYPIVNLVQLGLGVRKYIHVLEETVLKFLSAFGLRGEPNKLGSGVWVEGRKIASIGVRVKQRTTLHGLSLNLRNDPELFEYINPCGYKQVRTGSVADHVRIDATMNELAKCLAQILATKLGFNGVIFDDGSLEQQLR